MNSLPFTMRGVRTGLVDLEGVVRIEGPELVLEFRIRHALTRLLRSRPREVRFPLSELEEVTFRRFLCLGFLCLRARRMTVFNDVPGSDGALLRLRCAPAHWHAARELASCLGMNLLTQNLKAMVDATSPPIEPSPNTPPLPQAHCPPAPESESRKSRPAANPNRQ